MVFKGDPRKIHSLKDSIVMGTRARMILKMMKLDLILMSFRMMRMIMMVGIMTPMAILIMVIMMTMIIIVRI